jgi:hypothetical protein
MGMPGRYRGSAACLGSPKNPADSVLVIGRTGGAQAALNKVAGLKSDPKDPKSPTFGESIKAGKLPGGEPKEALNKP